MEESPNLESSLKAKRKKQTKSISRVCLARRRIAAIKPRFMGKFIKPTDPRYLTNMKDNKEEEQKKPNATN